MHLLAGAPGTGKTILASSFAYNAVTKLKERVVYATFEESAEYLQEEHEEARDRPRRGGEDGNLKVIDLDALKGKELENNIQLLIAAVKETKSTILIIDSLTALLLATESKFELRTFMKSVYKTLKSQGVTTLMTISRRRGRVRHRRVRRGLGDAARERGRKGPVQDPPDSTEDEGTEHSKRYHSVTFAPKMSVSKY